MDDKTKPRAVIAEPLKIKNSITDDWVQPFGCNHVVVSFSPEKTSGKKKTKKKKKKNEKVIDDENELLSFCVMCGETVSDNEQITRCDSVTTTIDDIKSPLKEPNVAIGETPRDTKRGKLFSSSRKSSSSSLTNINQSAQVTSNDSKACPIHSHKDIKYFCEDHQEICCSVCVNVLHRGCERIMRIKDELGNGWDIKHCHDTITALDSIAESFEAIIDHNKQAQKELHDQIDQFKSRREKTRKRLIEVLDGFDKTSDRMIKKFIKISEEEIQSTIETCNDAINETRASKELLEFTVENNSRKDSFITTQKVLKQKNKYGVALSESIKNCKRRAVDFIPELNIANIEHLDSVGKIEFSAEAVVFPESVVSSVSKLPKSEIRSPREVTSAFTRSDSSASLENQIHCIGRYNVRLADDKIKSENVAAMFLDDDRIAIVDMSNKKLKVFDPKFSKAHSVELTSEPRGVTVTSPLEVAVTLPDESKIQFITTHRRLSVTRSILTSLPCYGITCSNQELVVLCDDGFSTTAIQILDFEGKEIKTLKMNKSGHVILKNPWNLAVNLDGQQICVTDRSRLICVDLEGMHVFQYADENLVNARGLAVDNLGRYYVCGTGSGNVHQVSADGKKLGIVLNDSEVPSPQAVCYHKSRRLLLVTNVGDDHVFLYRVPR
ncbi:uncharacterized protein LOC128242479 [Mya arenaria]|nr:uncharacterized protein LOC128242479 [Mya arenaria]XP_052815597.1 uncharacterized protein LOC128242479 [Mya arenaria]